MACTYSSLVPRESEDGALGHVRRGPEPPAMRLDDGRADRQPHAHPVGLRAAERTEQPVEIPRPEPRAGILDGETGENVSPQGMHGVSQRGEAEGAEHGASQRPRTNGPGAEVLDLRRL